MAHPDAELARHRYSYDPETGEFRWRNVPNRGPRRKMAPGKSAGTVNPADGMLLLRLGSQVHSAARVAWLYIHGEWPARTVTYEDADLPLPMRNRLSNLALSGPKEDRLTHAELLRRMDYDAESGLFKWRLTRRGVTAGQSAGYLKAAGKSREQHWVIRIDHAEHSGARLAWFYAKGEWPEFRLGFADGDATNIRIANLFETNLKPYTIAFGALSEEERRNRRRIAGRRADLKRTFGITPEEYEAKAQEQNGLCAICGRPERMKRLGRLQQMPVDHDHATGKPRDLLCGECNIGLGKFEDNPEFLRAAIDYLAKWGIVEGVPLRKESV